MENTNEVWVPVYGYEGFYEISNFGVVRSVTRFVANSGRNGMWYKSRVMKTVTDKDGYLTVTLQKERKVKVFKVHRLVLMSFNQETSELQVNHIDGNKQNNNINNLEWCTCSENIKHAFSINLKTQKGSNNNGAKLNEEKVKQMCDLFKYTTMTNKEIAELYDIKSDETIRKIRKRLAWTHVTKDIDF